MAQQLRRRAELPPFFHHYLAMLLDVVFDSGWRQRLDSSRAMGTFCYHFFQSAAIVVGGAFGWFSLLFVRQKHHDLRVSDWNQRSSVESQGCP
jgi:hypothetical protein